MYYNAIIEASAFFAIGVALIPAVRRSRERHRELSEILNALSITMFACAGFILGTHV